MKKYFLQISVILFAALSFVSPAVQAWDGVSTGKIATIDVAPGSNFGFRVYFVGSPVMCTGGQAWAYLNETDSNYKVHVAMLMLAKAQGSSVTVYANLESGYCHIGYISVGQ